MTTSVLFIRVSLLLVSSFLIPMVRTPLCSSCQYDFFICSPSRVLILNMLFSFHLSPRVSAPLLNKVSMGVIGPKFAWTNRTGCCLSMAPALSRWFSYVCVCVSVCLCHIDAGTVCMPTSLCGRPTSKQPVTHTHFYTHTNVLDVLMLLEILVRLLLRLPRITPSATAPSNPNENSCYILNSQGDAAVPLSSFQSFQPHIPIWLWGAKFKFISVRIKYIVKRPMK